MLKVPPHLDDGAWFHGSPLELQVLAAGSTVTRCRAVAEAFSHKPTWVSVGVPDEDRPVTVAHNGLLPGYLYVVDEPVADSDLHPHPRSSFKPGGLEWITDRPLRLCLVGELPAPEKAPGHTQD
jgi:hypothetical protein